MFDGWFLFVLLGFAWKNNTHIVGGEVFIPMTFQYLPIFCPGKCVKRNKRSTRLKQWLSKIVAPQNDHRGYPQRMINLYFSLKLGPYGLVGYHYSGELPSNPSLDIFLPLHRSRKGPEGGSYLGRNKRRAVCSETAWWRVDIVTSFGKYLVITGEELIDP